MPGRIVAVKLVAGCTITSNAALAQRDPVAGTITSGAIVRRVIHVY
jgi:hypothetical protein